MTDFIQLPRLLPKKCDVMLRFIPVSPELYLIGETPHKLKILDARLYVNKVKLTTSLSRELCYPTTRWQGRTKILNTGEQNLDWVPFKGKRPRRLYVIQIDQKSYDGDKKMNPFNLQTFKLSRIQVFFNDVSLPTNMGSTLGDNDLARCYLNSLKAVNNSEAWDIALDDYDKGYFLYVVDLTKDHSASSNYRSEESQGSIRLIMDYKDALTKPIAVMCFAEYDDVLTINDDGNPQWT